MNCPASVLPAFFTVTSNEPVWPASNLCVTTFVILPGERAGAWASPMRARAAADGLDGGGDVRSLHSDKKGGQYGHGREGGGGRWARPWQQCACSE